MTLDPIVSLAVALAEAPGTCAFFVGSGVSRDAGVPTGSEILQDGLQRLHQLEIGSTERLDDDALQAWLAETERVGITYSELLELITPDPAVRREYLASFFRGAEPGPTHEALAGLAADGIVRVFVTTNFDRLLEHALQARGIEPIVIASDADLAAAVPREHADCFVLKPHGDYLRETIRNTPSELADLEPDITGQLDEVFSNYGVAVLGYSGSDEAVARALRARRSRYGVWWVSRGELTDTATDLVETVGARLITRDSAAEFLADLGRRLQVFSEHPSGYTPATAHDATIALIRASDTIGLKEELRQEREVYRREITAITAEYRQAGGAPPTDESLTELWTRLRPILERRLASLLPVALYEPDIFEREMNLLARDLELRPLVGGLVVWGEIPEYAVTWMGYVLGALLVRLDHMDRLGPLIRPTWANYNRRAQPIVSLPGELSSGLGKVLAPPPKSGHQWIVPGWEFLARESIQSDWLKERYPELFGQDEPRRSMAQFDLIHCLAEGFSERRSVAFFTAGGDAATQLAARLHNDPALRESVAGLMGLTLEEFDEDASRHVSEAHELSWELSTSPGEVASALSTGSAF